MKCSRHELEAIGVCSYCGRALCKQCATAAAPARLTCEEGCATALAKHDRALEVLLGSDDVSGTQAEMYGYVNRAIPDADLDTFVEALAARIAKFDKWAIAQTKRLVNTTLPPDVELGAGWDACIASLGRPAAQSGIKALMDRGFHQPGDVENRLGYYVSAIHS